MLVFEDISNEKRARRRGTYMTDDRRTYARQRHLELSAAQREARPSCLRHRGFTSLTEKLARRAVAFLNDTSPDGRLHRRQRDARQVHRRRHHGGFRPAAGARRDEDRAVRASIAMIRECRKWSAERTQRGQPMVAWASA